MTEQVFEEGQRVVTKGDTVPPHLRNERGEVVEVTPGIFRPVMVELDQQVDPGVNGDNALFAFKRHELRPAD